MSRRVGRVSVVAFLALIHLRRCWISWPLGSRRSPVTYRPTMRSGQNSAQTSQNAEALGKQTQWHVGVIGAGVAGLVCARELRRAGLGVEVFEASDGVGGRVRTDMVPLPGAKSSTMESAKRPFLLDRGFQILIEAYPEVRRQLDLQSLRLRGFVPGAVLAFGGGDLRIVADPTRSPKYLFKTLSAGIANFRDLLSLGMLRLKQVFLERPYAALERSSKAGARRISTEDFLTDSLCLSSNLVERFLRPFFEAIYVTPLREQSSACFEFVLRMLADGGTSLPSTGMQAIPEQLAEGLMIHLQSPVAEIRQNGLRLESGEWKDFDAVVVAADWPSAGKLASEISVAQGTQSSTWYFALPSPPPVKDPIIILNSTLQQSDSQGSFSRIVNVGFPSIVQPTYAPDGWDLAAVTIRGSCDVEESWVRGELRALFGLGSELDTWQLLRVYNLGFHQPQQTRRLWPPREPFLGESGVYLCGDHCAEPTLDSAMRSGRRAAEAILQARCADLGRRPPERSKPVDISRLIYDGQDVVSKLDSQSRGAVRWNIHRTDAVRLSRLITAAGKLRDWRGALHLLEGSASQSIRRNAVLFTSAMQPCVSAQQWPAALATELSMRQAGVKPDPVASNTLINAGSRFSNWPFGLCILESLCETDGALEDRRRLGLEVPEPSFDRTTFNSAITACIDGKTWNTAVWLFGSLIKESLKPDHVTFTGAACACAIGGAWRSTLELLSVLPPPMQKRRAGSRLNELTRSIVYKDRLGEEDDERSLHVLRTFEVHKELSRLRKERPVMQRNVRDRTWTFFRYLAQEVRVQDKDIRNMGK
ncbi:PPOX2 [Symbiodinium sp. CCMP2456]|nr:PPOX2 [Symbiodinium sp. CCMP2456]